MKRKVLLAALSTLLYSTIHADTLTHPSQTNGIKHVIYLTLDGVRWQDVYQTHRYFPKLWREHAHNLRFYGMPNSKSTMEVASVPLGLPSYQSQMSGAIQSCHDNQCGHVRVKTLPEYLRENLHLTKKDIVIFSSWPVMTHAIESKAGASYSNAGNVPVTDPFSYRPDGVMSILNEEQENDHPLDKPNRYDKYTFSQALHYFEKHQPRFMWISLVNADDEAHRGHLDQYHAMLTYYDDALDGLFDTLKSMNLEKKTMVIVTTDHGRGNNDKWTSHGPEYPESKQTWAFVMNGELQPISHDGDIYHYSTLSIRPTIEKALN